MRGRVGAPPRPPRAPPAPAGAAERTGAGGAVAAAHVRLGDGVRLAARRRARTRPLGSPRQAPASPSPAAAAAAASPEALLAMLQSSTAGAEGVGVIATSASVASGYVLRPQEQAAWSQRLAPLVTNLQGVLSAVGPLKFCQMIDGVANPNDWSLAVEVAPNLQRGARLEVVQDNAISAAIEASAVAAANTGAQVRLVVAVDQSVVGAPGHNDTGSPVMVCRVDHIVDGATGLTRVASFALHLEPVSQLQRRRSPRTSAWCLPGSACARRLPPPPRLWLPPARRVLGGAASAAAAAGPRRAPALGGGGGVRRPGDWTCPGCHAHNFASRSVCFKCKNAKAGGSGGGGGFSGDVSKSSEPAGVPGGQLPPRRLDLHRLPRAQLCLQVCVLQVQAAQVRR